MASLNQKLFGSSMLAAAMFLTTSARAQQAEAPATATTSAASSPDGKANAKADVKVDIINETPAAKATPKAAPKAVPTTDKRPVIVVRTAPPKVDVHVDVHSDAKAETPQPEAAAPTAPIATGGEPPKVVVEPIAAAKNLTTTELKGNKGKLHAFKDSWEQVPEQYEKTDKDTVIEAAPRGDCAVPLVNMLSEDGDIVPPKNDDCLVVTYHHSEVHRESGTNIRTIVSPTVVEQLTGLFGALGNVGEGAGTIIAAKAEQTYSDAAKAGKLQSTENIEQNTQQTADQKQVNDQTQNADLKANLQANPNIINNATATGGDAKATATGGKATVVNPKAPPHKGHQPPPPPPCDPKTGKPYTKPVAELLEPMPPASLQSRVSALVSVPA